MKQYTEENMHRDSAGLWFGIYKQVLPFTEAGKDNDSLVASDSSGSSLA